MAENEHVRLTVQRGPEALAAPAPAPMPMPADDDEPRKAPMPPVPPPPTATPDGLLIDAKGRRLKLRELTMLQEMDLMSLAGDAKTLNRAWWMNATAAARVAEIDGVPVTFPTSDQELRVMIARVDREGIAAVIMYLFPSAGESAADTSDEARAKN